MEWNVYSNIWESFYLNLFSVYLMQIQMETDEQDEEIRIISFSLNFLNIYTDLWLSLSLLKEQFSELHFTLI